jgi:hypothetical protein
MAEPVLQAELWVSFASLLRAYAAAAEAHGGVGTRVEAADGTLTLTAGRVALRVECDVASGAGTWMRRRADAELARGAFRLLESGLLEQDGQEMDLDHAAIDWIAQLMRAGRER